MAFSSPLSRIALFLGVCMIFAGAQTTFAQSLDVQTSATEVAQTAGFSQTSFIDILGTLINIVLSLLGVVFLFLVLYAGWLWMNAQGDPKQIEKARGILINGVVGLVILLSAYAITTFVINFLSDSGLVKDGNKDVSYATVAVERLSGALGSGSLRDHYPERNATDIPRNARVIVTFKQAVMLEDIILNYDDNGTPEDVSDDVSQGDLMLNTDVVKIYRTADGQETALSNVTVAFSSDLHTVVFDPQEYLGSPSSPVSYSVFLSGDFSSAQGDAFFTGEYADGYLWSFETGTTIDTEPPTLLSVVPSQGSSYARNITVQMTFDEPIDPLSASGTRESSGGYDIIQTSGSDRIPLRGTYALSNGYTTVTFIPTDACGTNSCGDTLYCLPGDQTVSVLVQAATVGSNPPQVDVYPYDGIADVSGNALDGNNDGAGGDDISWWFSTTDSIALDGPVLETISPNILGSDVALDIPITAVFSDVLLADTVVSDVISLTNKEAVSQTSHELWYRPKATYLDGEGNEVHQRSGVAQKTLVTLSHGTFLESIEGKTYMYGVTLGSGIKNAYQNCYVPAEGPGRDGGVCSGPSCCNGKESSETCDLF